MNPDLQEHMPAATDDDGRMVLTGVRRLTPATTTIFEGSFSLLHCSVQNDTLYRGVYCLLLFPIRYPEGLISVRYTDMRDKDREIGIIEQLTDWPAQAQALVRASLRKQYYERIIRRILAIENRFGLLFFSVQTQIGPEDFVMRWAHDRTEEYGERGKVLRDAFDNRFIIQDVTALPAADQRRFTAFIYW